MAPNPIPLFSDFHEHETPQSHKYWLPVTAAQMAKAYIHHGPAYFDLHKDQSYEYVPLTRGRLCKADDQRCAFP